MTTKVTHLYDDYVKPITRCAISKRPGSRQPMSASCLASTTTGKGSTMPPGAVAGASVGALAGAGTGLLTALGVIAIPGLGPLVAAGVLATTLAGTAAGAATGGLLGALMDYGVSEEDAHVYSEGVRRGGTLVTVRAPDDRVALAHDILNQHHPVDIPARRRSYNEEGWKPTIPMRRDIRAIRCAPNVTATDDKALVFPPPAH